MSDRRKGVGTTEQVLTEVAAAVDQATGNTAFAADVANFLGDIGRSRQTQLDSILQNANLQGGNFFDQLKKLLELDSSGQTAQITSTVRDIVGRDPTLAQNEEALTNAIVAEETRRNPRLGTPEGQSQLRAITGRARRQAKAVVTENTLGVGSNTRYPVVAYSDKLSTTPEIDPEDTVALPGSNLVRYADDDREESNSPVFLIDAVIWVQGIEISQFVKGQVSISLNGTDGNNAASFTLDNSNDRFVWTERNLIEFYGESALLANAPYIAAIQSRLDAAVNEAVENTTLNFENTAQKSIFAPENLRQFAFTGDEREKAEMFAYKADPNRNPPIKNPKNSIAFARYDLAPNRSIFNRMDPVRIFSLYPFRVPGKQYESGKRLELWCPEFTGYIDNVSLEDDDIRGVSTITIDCHDIKEGVLGKMRVSTDLTSGLATPLEALGFRSGPISTPETGGAPPTPQDRAFQQQFKDNTAGFYDINNTLFYDDVSVTPFSQQVSPNAKLEDAIYSLLVAKEPITIESNNRGVRGVSLGGNFYYDSAQTNIPEARKFLEDWHKFCLFGPKRRPWTRDEMEAVGRGTTSDGTYAPNKVRLWFMLPKEGTGPKNLADLSNVSIQMSHEVNWTNRLEIVRNFASALDYNWMVSPCGDFIVEFPMVDFRPEDFGEFKSSFRVDKGMISTTIGDEQQNPPAGLVVQTGFAAGAGAPDGVAGNLARIFVYSPYIAARYGVEIVNDSIPFLQLKDRAVAQQRAIVMYQKILARSHVMTAQFSYRPFLLPNRPLHHLRRSRIGNVVSMEKNITLGVSPKGEVTCGLDNIRLFTGYYRNQAALETLNEIQQADIANSLDPSNTALLAGIDPVTSPDPIDLQVFNTVAAGESTPSSARVGWGPEAILAPASGIYVLDLDAARPKVAGVESVETAHEPAPEVGDTTTPIVSDEPPNKDKFRANPLAATPLVVTSPFGPRKSPITGKVGTPHNAVDFEAAQGSGLFAVEDGVVRKVGEFDKRSGYTVIINTANGYGVRYQHMDAEKIRASGPMVQVGQEVTAGQLIGYSGGAKGTAGAGQTTGPHLHIQVYGLRDNKTRDITQMCPGPFSGKTAPKSPTKSTS
jgi:murein DD-endopeptidase MepM/ murein hydrolase activator NlpD